MLKDNASPADKDEFLQEAAIMQNFCHVNVLGALGHVVQSEPVLIVLEFMELGSLYSVSWRHVCGTIVMCGHLDSHEACRYPRLERVVSGTLSSSQTTQWGQVLRRGGSELDSRLQAALDIVAGMTYLHGLHYIHRDLATCV